MTILSFFPQQVFRYVVLTLLLCGSQVAASAQARLTGQALDQQKHEAVPYATVVLKTPGADGKTVQSALTDESGHFALKVAQPGGYQLAVLMLGYAPLTLPVEVAASAADVSLGVLELQPAAQNLQEVVIQGQRPLLEHKPDRITMNVAQSVLAIGNDTYSILAMAPAVQLTEGRLTFRGKSNVLILLNGKRLPGATLESVLASIPGDQVERIELISNPSAKYDADASGGVIEIYTKRSKELGWTANVGGNFSQGYRPGGGGNAGLRINTPKIDFATSLSANNRGGIERGYETRTFYQGRTAVGNLYQHNDFTTTLRDASLNASLNYHFNTRSTAGAEVQLMHVGLTGTGNVSATIQEPAGAAQSASQNEVSLLANLRNYNAFYKRTLDSLGSSVVLATNLATYHNYQQQVFDQRLTLPDSVVRSQFRNQAPSDYTIVTNSADYTRKWGAGTQLEAGLKHTSTLNQSRQVVEVGTPAGWQEQPATPFSRLGYREQVGAGYVSLNHTLGPVTLQAGLRAEQTRYRVVNGRDSSYFNLFPNLRADYKHSDNYTTSVAYARNINRPSYQSLIPYELFINNYTSRRGNAALRPEYAHSLSWSHLYKGLSLQLAYTQTTNAISSVYLYDQPTLRFVLTEQNFLRRHLGSATLSASATPAKWWTMNNSASAFYQQLSFPDPTSPESLVLKNKLYYTGSSDNTFTLGHGWTAQVAASVSTASFSGMLDYSGYSSVRVGIKKTMLDKRATLKLDVTDVFYQSNVRVSSAVVPVVTESLTRNDTRRVRVAFTYRLGKTGLKNKRVETKGNGDELNRLGL